MKHQPVAQETGKKMHLVSRKLVVLLVTLFRFPEPLAGYEEGAASTPGWHRPFLESETVWAPL
jgi:hypothetical protein